MRQIALTTLANARCHEQSCESPNEVRAGSADGQRGMAA